MNARELQKRGRLVPMRPTGIGYQVRHGIEFARQVPSYKKRLHSTRWTSCSVRLLDAGSIPNGTYFLYTDEGKVLQLRSIDGKWQYLAEAA
jgi:hypothetical protein